MSSVSRLSGPPSAAYDVDILVAAQRRVEGHPLTVRRPRADVDGGALQVGHAAERRPISPRDPHLLTAATVRRERDLGAVGRKASGRVHAGGVAERCVGRDRVALKWSLQIDQSKADVLLTADDREPVALSRRADAIPRAKSTRVERPGRPPQARGRRPTLERAAGRSSLVARRGSRGHQGSTTDLPRNPLLQSPICVGAPPLIGMTNSPDRPEPNRSKARVLPSGDTLG